MQRNTRHVRQRLATLMSGVILFSFMGTPNALADTTPGCGVRVDGVHQVATAAQLRAVGSGGAGTGDCGLGAAYLQTADIDLSGSGAFTPIGTFDHPFTGTFDGGRHAIRGLTINLPGTTAAALFGMAQTALLSNIRLIDVDITALDSVGAIVGYQIGGSLSHSSATGTVTGSGTAFRVGGLVGVAQNRATLASLASAVVVDAKDTDAVGGLAGVLAIDSSVRDSYATGSVKGRNQVGGLIGELSDSSIINSFAGGSVTATSASGGLVGKTFSTLEIVTSFFDTDATGTTVSAGGTGQTTNDMKTLSTFQDDWHIGAGWEPFDADTAVWGICAGVNDNYPFLLWEYAANPCASLIPQFDTPVSTADGFTFTVSNYPITPPFLLGDTDLVWQFDGATVTPDGSGQVTGLDPGQSVTITATTTHPRLPTGTNTFTASALPLPACGPLVNGAHQVTTAAQLRAVGSGGAGTGDCGLGAEYLQSANIDLSGSGDFPPIGTADHPFTGTFDGANHLLTGVTVNIASYAGLFGVANGATVRNVNLTALSVTGDKDADGHSFAGGLIGSATNTGLTGVTVAGLVTATGTQVGGLIGFADKTTVSNVSAEGVVEGADWVGGLIGLAKDTTVTQGVVASDVTGVSGVGGLIGDVLGVTVLDATVSGAVAATVRYAGGLIGHAETATVTTSTSTSVVSGLDRVGGLVGYAEAVAIDGASASGSVTGTDRLGGLIGEAIAVDVTNTTASGTVDGDDSVGALIGHALQSAVTGSSASGTVTGRNDIGGLVGHGETLTLLNTTATGGVTGTDRVGGLIGSIAVSAALNDVSASGAVTGSRQVGGLLGQGENIAITRATASGTVFARSTQDSFAGGLIGSSNVASIVQSHASGAVSGSGSLIGGFIGSAVTTAIANSTARGDTAGVGTGSLRIGGFIGRADQTSVGNVMALGDVEGQSYVGGLIGQALNNTFVSAAAAFGDVTGTKRLGGLIGDASETMIINAYARGRLFAVGAPNQLEFVGGLVGSMADTSITDTFATGKIHGQAIGFSGGLIGAAGVNSAIASSFWDLQTSEQAVSDGGIGHSTATLTTFATFRDADWNIVENWAPFVTGTTIWGICPGANDGYPYLLWEHDDTPCVSPAAELPSASQDTLSDEDAADNDPTARTEQQRSVHCSLTELRSVVCVLAGGEPDEAVSWSAAFNPTFATGTLTLDAAGRGQFGFVVPPEAAGRPIIITIDGWDAPFTLAGAAPVPTGVPAGQGVAPIPAPVSLFLLLLLVGGAWHVRHRAMAGVVPRR